MHSKSVLLILFLFLIVGWEMGYLTHSYFVPNKTLAEEPLPTVTPTPTPIISVPQTLVIPSLNIRAAVEAVGIADGVRMDVPKVPTDVAWYTGGARPGQIGNVAIDGHYDTDTGAAAVFYTLKDINIGDPIQIIDEQNHLYVYKVTKVDSFSNQDFPFTEIFGKSDQAHLYLITCDGIWNRQEQNYSRRAVVTAELEEE